MNNTIKMTLATLAFALAGAAQASTITFETGSSIAGLQADAATLRDLIDAPGVLTHSASVSLYDAVSNNSVFGAGNSNIAYKVTVNFDAATAGTWQFRAGVDFGHGGAMFLDGVAVDYKTGDMWWSNDWNNTSSVLLSGSQALSSGSHTMTLYGLEDCCDGGQKAQFSSDDGQSFTTFGTNDGITTSVPEPESYAMMLAGLGLLGFAARRKSA